MGFTPEPTLYRLKFEEPSMAGLEVVAESVSTGEFLELTELADLAKPAIERGQEDSEEMAEARSAVTKLLRAFAGALAEWNLEDKRKTPVPATYEGLLTQKLDFNFKVIMAWIEAIGDVDVPLPQGSPAGATSPEESLQLASSSRSLPS